MINRFSSVLAILALMAGTQPAVAASFHAPKTARGTINMNNNDATEVANGTMYLKCKQLELGSIKGVKRFTGLRFRIDIPKKATITSAKITFKANEWSNQDPVMLMIQVQDSANGEVFKNKKKDVTGRKKTHFSVTWQPVQWAKNKYYKSPDFKGAIQRVVDMPGWKPGNNIVVAVVPVSGKGVRTAFAREGVGSTAPVLNVEYTLTKKSQSSMKPTKEALEQLVKGRQNTNKPVIRR